MIKVMTDTTSSLTRDQFHDSQIIPIPLLIKNGRQTLKDLFEIQSDEFYKLQRKGDKFTTAHLDSKEFLDFFHPPINLGYEVLCILLSSSISSSVAMANQAKEMMNNHPKIKIFDSRHSGFGQAYMALKAKEMADRDVKIDEIIEYLEELRERTHTYFIVESLDHLKAGGRFFWDQAMIASVLRIKPVIWFDRNGKMKINNKISSIKAVRERILHLVADCGKRGIEKIALQYADNLDEATEFAKELEKVAAMPVPLIKLSPVIGAHTGPDLLGPCIITKH